MTHRVVALDTSADSVSAVSLKVKATKAFEEFMRTSDKYEHASLCTLSANVLCNSAIYLEFAQWLVEQRSPDKTGRWKPATIEKYLRTMVRLPEEMFAKEVTREFVESIRPMDSGGDTWIRSAVRKVHVVKFREAVANHESTVTQASPIYSLHMREICKQLWLHSTAGGGADSIERALLLALVHKSAGRPGEVSTFSFDSTTWDPHYKMLVATWPQFKSHKFKMLGVMAGRDRHDCLFTTFACAFACGLYKHTAYDPEGMNFLFPKLDETACHHIRKILRDMTPGTALKTFAAHMVESLPVKACGSGTVFMHA